MNKIIISAVVTGAVIVGYAVYRILKRPGRPSVIIDEVLTLKNIFAWVDDEMVKQKEEKNSEFEINVLPNLESQQITKTKNKYIYVAVLRKKNDDGQYSTISTKVFYAKAVDIDLNALTQGDIVVIPIA